MVAELRSRVKTKNTSQLVILPADAVETAAMALDLGADDVVTTQISSGEMKM